jgi:hypothetical protein
MTAPNNEPAFTLEFVLNTLPQEIAENICKINNIDYKEACAMYEIRSYDLGGLQDDDEEWVEEE